MIPAPRCPDPDRPGSAAAPWIEIARRCYRRAGRLHEEAHRRNRTDNPYCAGSDERYPEYRAALFWYRVAKRAERYAGVR